MKTAHNRAVDWFYRFWVIPLCAVVWFGGAAWLFVVFWPLGILALLVAAVLFGELLSYRPTEKTGPRSNAQPSE